MIDIFEIFKIGIGPSSSHTVGPMRAAKLFIEAARTQNLLDSVNRVEVSFYGSLGQTGRGHGSDSAVVWGLLGHEPESVNLPMARQQFKDLDQTSELLLLGERKIHFSKQKDLRFLSSKKLPFHPNGMTFKIFDQKKALLLQETFFSVGGGTILQESKTPPSQTSECNLIPHPFSTGKDLLEQCKDTGFSIGHLMRQNQLALYSQNELDQKLLTIWETMKTSILKGSQTEGVLPGFLRVKRRAPELARKLKQSDPTRKDPLVLMDWVNLYAIAVNEENAAGERIVTAPTNGAAGVLPAVLYYFLTTTSHQDPQEITQFLLCAGAIASLYQKNASISGAEVGCQGEVGVACSMAAGALTELNGGTPEQVENAAEIAMEHNLGLTCDPVGGYVQIPCIERNAMAAVKAINASRLALRGDGQHRVSLDKVIKTMWDTGADMKDKYKETSRGGLAVNVIEC